jgi:hypothetical protein
MNRWQADPDRRERQRPRTGSGAAARPPRPVATGSAVEGVGSTPLLMRDTRPSVTTGISMAARPSADLWVAGSSAAGYEVDGVLADISIEESVCRADALPPPREGGMSGGPGLRRPVHPGRSHPRPGRLACPRPDAGGVAWHPGGGEVAALIAACHSGRLPSRADGRFPAGGGDPGGVFDGRRGQLSAAVTILLRRCRWMARRLRRYLRLVLGAMVSQVRRRRSRCWGNRGRIRRGS